MNLESMFGQRRSGWEKFSSQQNTNEGKQQGGSKTSETRKTEADERGFGQGATAIYGKRAQSHLPHSKWRSKLEGDKWDLDQGAGAIYGKRAQPQSPHMKWRRPLVYPIEEDRKKALQAVNKNLAVKNGSNQKLESVGKEKEEDISKELQTLAQELGITEGSPQEIIQAACRKAKELEELKKNVFSIKNVNDKEHDIEKAKAKIQDLHRCQEDLTLIKTAVMNPNKSKDFTLTQSTEEVVERINTLHGEIQNLKERTTKDQTKGRAMDLESNLEELKKVFSVKKVKDKEHDIEKTKAKIQDLHRAADESKNDIQVKKVELEKMEKEIDLLKEQLKDTENKHQTLLKTYQEREQKLQNDLKEVKSQKEIALTRLSEVAGAKLTESNPYIIDLRDPNRPEKIGEQFSELYDTLWTDVFEKLSDTCKLSERDSIQTLLQILEDSYGYCKDISSKRYSNTLAELTLWKLVEANENPSQKKKGKNTSEKKKDADTKETIVNITLEELQKLQTLLVSPSSSSPADIKAVDSILAKIGLNVTSLSNIKKMLKSSLEGTSVIVQESFWKQRSEDPNGQKEVLECTKPFLMKCVHICWLMVGQDPPVYLRFSDKSGDKFNKDVFREYTTHGKVLDFVVWPATFLHENGPLLQKGFAQPIAKK